MEIKGCASALRAGAREFSMNRREQIEAMLREEPNDPELRYMLAMEHVSANDDAAAVACFEELLRRRPDFPPAYHMAARALQRLDRIAQAREMLQRGIPIAQARQEAHSAGEMQELLDMLEAER
jgi:predicted Zn-dependent protease